MLRHIQGKANHKWILGAYSDPFKNATAWRNDDFSGSDWLQASPEGDEQYFDPSLHQSRHRLGVGPACVYELRGKRQGRHAHHSPPTQTIHWRAALWQTTTKMSGKRHQRHHIRRQSHHRRIRRKFGRRWAPAVRQDVRPHVLHRA